MGLIHDVMLQQHAAEQRAARKIEWRTSSFAFVAARQRCGMIEA